MKATEICPQFLQDFKLTAAEAILKQALECHKSETNVTTEFSESPIIQTAMAVCERFLVLMRDPNDGILDSSGWIGQECITNEEWECLKNYSFSHNENLFLTQQDANNVEHLLESMKRLLSQVIKVEINCQYYLCL